MNDLTLLTDAELDKRVAEVREREQSIKTDAGRKAIQARIREMINDLNGFGYSSQDMDIQRVAELWADVLGEDFIRLGTEGVRQAVKNWVHNDDFHGKQFPKVAWIKEECKKMGGDPRVELGRREQKRREKALEDELQRKIEVWEKENPEAIKRWEERVDKKIFGK